MPEQRIEYEFDFECFMADVRQVVQTSAGKSDLRTIEALTGISAGTMSRIGRNNAPEIDTYLRICSRLELTPGNYFKRIVWQKVDG